MFLSRKSTPRSTRGLSLIELMIVIAMIAAIAAMSFGIYAKVKANAEKAKCKAKIKAIGIALASATVAREDGYPLPPEDIDDGSSDNEESDEKMDEWWFHVLKDYGMDNPEAYVCPSQMSEFKRLQKENNVKYYSSYTIIPYKGKEEPYRSMRQPWVVDKYSHTEGRQNVYLPDGTVTELLLPGY